MATATTFYLIILIYGNGNNILLNNIKMMATAIALSDISK